MFITITNGISDFNCLEIGIPLIYWNTTSIKNVFHKYIPIYT